MPLLVVLCFPFVINPSTLDSFKQNFHVILLPLEFCNLDNECRHAVEHSLVGGSTGLSYTYFPTFKLVYVRPVSVDEFDRLIILLFIDTYPLKYVTSRIFESLELEVETYEIIHVAIAFWNSMLYGVVRGLTISKLAVFFLVVLISSIIEAWLPIVTVINTILLSSTVSQVF